MADNLRSWQAGIQAIVLSLLLCCAGQATISQVQPEVTGTCAGTSCTASAASTGAGHILIAVFELQSGSVSAVSDSTGETWLHNTACAITSAGSDVDCWYILSSTAGATSITATVTSGTGRAMQFYEFAIGSGCSAVYDSSNAAVNSTATGPGLTLTGVNDVIVQGIYTTTTVSSIGGGYNLAAATGNVNRTAAALLNTISSTATWTLTSTATAAVNAIAIAESCPVSSITVTPTSITMSASQTQQFAATVTGTANATAVTWSIGAGVGSISSTGVYTAPSTIGSPQTVTVTATTVVAPTVSASATVSLLASGTLATFSLNELFGQAWPYQPIEFAYNVGTGAPTGNTRMLGPLGVEVPYQWVSSCSDTTATNGCIVVWSNLPANAGYTWTLQSGIAPTVTPSNIATVSNVVNPVQTNPSAVDSNGITNIEITNGLTGVRIVANNPSPYNLAPIQGIWTHGGTWTGVGATTPNYLYSEASTGGSNYSGCVGCVLQTKMYTAAGYTVTVDPNSGPLKTVVTVNYTFNRPQYTYLGTTVINTAGTGHYTLIVTLYANSKSVLIDEDTDMQFSYYLPVYSQLQPDTARWRGHDSWNGNGNNTEDPLCGYESPLTVTGATNATPVVITTSASGSLSNGQVVLIAAVQGNTAANGTYYAMTNCSGCSANQFALYSNSTLTTPVAGTGGYSGGGTVKPAYRGQNVSPVADAYQDLTYTLDRPASYQCVGVGNNAGYRKLLADYPSTSHAAGWYVEMYNSQAGSSSAPVVGFYVGRASKQDYSATGPSLPGIYSSNSHWITPGQQAAGIQVDTLLRNSNGGTTTVVHRNWGIFTSTQADLLSPSSHQPIADEQNELTGINLSRLYTYQLVYPDPSGGWQPLYLAPAALAQLQSWVQDGTTSFCGTPTCYATLLKNSEGSPPGLALLGLWQATTQAQGQAAVTTALSSATSLAYSLVHALAAGDNHFDTTLGYYQLGLQSSPETVVLNAILVTANTNPTYVTAAQKTLAKAELALFGSIFWDDDWFPIPDANDNNYNSGEGVGLANQVQQYLEYRTQSVLSDPSQPFLSAQQTTALSYSTQDFASYFDSTGAAAGSTHYQSTFFEPLILNYMNRVTPGLLSLSDPKWAAYAQWELSIQTPPEPRFGNLRKVYSNGDGNTEGDVRTAMLGTALNPVNPSLAGNLMWAWQQSNSPNWLTEDSQFVTTLAVIDPTIPAVTPQLGSINIPGYHSVERFNFGTPHETALWFINGGFYSPGGHRHYDDGQVSMYALSAPLAIDWNANLYSPETPGRVMHNSIVYDSEWGGPTAWSTDQRAVTEVSTLFQNPTNTEFAAFTNSTTSTGTFTSGDGTVWTRTVRTMNFNPSYPIVYVKDTFSGASAGTGKTLTWNLMATGAVSTPAGSITPTTRFSQGCQSPAGALPSNGTVTSLSAGLSHFNFTGVTWPAHATQGIDWDLFELPADGTAQFFIGNWGHGCHPVREESEFQQANSVPFAESQHILRVHDTGTSFTTVILPYRKTETPTRSVTQPSCASGQPGVQIVQGTETSCFNDSMASYAGRKSRMLTTYDATTQSAFGFTASGGPQEVVVQSDQIEWTIGGVTAGARSLTLPGNWYPNPATGVSRSGNTYSYTYAGGQQTAPVTITFSQFPWP